MIVRFIVVLAVLFGVSLIALARLSMAAPRLGLKEGKLLPCPGTPNCVNSQDQPQWAIRLPPSCDSRQSWLKLQDVVVALGGHVLEKNEDYLWAEFHSKWLGFVDDFEARLDREQGLIHLRSASRVGYSDFGVNTRRVKAVNDKMHLFFEYLNTGQHDICIKSP